MKKPERPLQDDELDLDVPARYVLVIAMLSVILGVWIGYVIRGQDEAVRDVPGIECVDCGPRRGARG